MRLRLVAVLVGITIVVLAAFAVLAADLPATSTSTCTFPRPATLRTASPTADSNPCHSSGSLSDRSSPRRFTELTCTVSVCVPKAAVARP